MEQRQGAVEGVAVNQQFWRGKRVFLTGHTGFKGSWMALWLRQLGAEVTGYALEPPTNPSLYELARVGEGLRSIIRDVRDDAGVEAAVREARPEIVFHMAAQSLVRRSYADPLGTYATNVLGTANVLEAIRQVGGVRVAVVVTSDKCYQNDELGRAFVEDDPMGGHDPYSSSKGCAELVAAAYRASFLAKQGTAVATARAGNVIGGGDFAEDRLIPDMVRAISEGKPARIRNPHAVRPWQHVLEPLSGYLLLAERMWHDPKFAQSWNFGPDDADCRPVADVLQGFIQLWGEGASWQADAGAYPHEAGFLKLDCSKARQLGWEPRWDLETALRTTVRWYQAQRAGQDLRALTFRQIAEHQPAEVADSAGARQ